MSVHHNADKNFLAVADDNEGSVFSMYRDEFNEKVGTISILVSDAEYQEIYRDYAHSDLHKDEFLDEWRENKKASFAVKK